MRSTMSDFPLTVGHIFEHGRATYADSVVVTAEAEGTRRISFAALAERAEQLAAGLRRLGVRHGDRVATFAWNTQEHQEAYFAVPCMGAVLHTVNIRLSPDQIRYIVGHAEDSVMLIDASLAPVLAPLIGELTTVRHLIVFGGGDRCGLPGAIDYEELLRSEPPGYRWPALEESAAAAMCYTSGTTDLPKGVVYSHRSTFLHSLGVCSGEALGLSQYDRILPVVPMFHGSAWGLPYAGWLVGADLVLPSRFIQAARLARLIAEERATFAAAVPTVWYDLLGLDPVTVDLSALRMVMCGGAAVPRSLIEAYEQRFGVRLVQGWGLTETSPVASLAFPPKTGPAERAIDYRSTAGRVLGGVEIRVVDDGGEVLPRDGRSVGEIEVRGPWVTAGYYLDPAPSQFHEAGSAPATSAASTPRATSRSATGPRTSSSRAASGSPRWIWSLPSSLIRPSARPRSSPRQTSGGENGRSPASPARLAGPSLRRSSGRTSPTAWSRGGCPSAGRL
jgi:fatty-acyl-CoA synthase